MPSPTVTVRATPLVNVTLKSRDEPSDIETEYEMVTVGMVHSTSFPGQLCTVTVLGVTRGAVVVVVLGHRRS